jgi:hypothetical protein
MVQQLLIPTDFWIELEQSVSTKVDQALNKGKVPRELLISYLRDLEIMARTACARRQTVQIIASGRSLLGDREVLGPPDGPFARASVDVSRRDLAAE